MNKADEFAAVSKFCLNSTIENINHSTAYYYDSKDKSIIIADMASTMIRELFQFYNDHGDWPLGLIDSLITPHETG